MLVVWVIGLEGSIVPQMAWGGVVIHGRLMDNREREYPETDQDSE